MNHADIFQLLIEYFIKQSLSQCAPYIAKEGLNEGRIISPLTGATLDEGAENEFYKGIMILSDGETLESTLRVGGVISDEETGDFCHVGTKADLFAYLNSQTNTDGVLLYNRPHEMMARIFNAKPPEKDKVTHVGSYLPCNFVHSESTQPVQNGEVGTKTKLAVKVTQAFPNLHAYQIKRTVYGDLGMGKVTHFTEQGLYEEFFLRYDQQTKTIYGVYTRYDKKGEEFVPCECKETFVLKLEKEQRRQRRQSVNMDLERCLDMAA